jgi:polar amino acid transport system permease protein
MLDAIGPLLHGAVATLTLSLCATVLATIIGVIAAIAAQSSTVLRWLVVLYVSFIRGTPLLIQVLVIFYILPAVGIDVPPFGAGLVALGVNGGAHIREIIRGALTTIPPGQVEAARALALPRPWIWARIILPQIFAIILPPLTVEFSALLKGSALVSVVGYVELTRQAQYLLSTTARPFTIWIMTALLYFAMCYTLAILTRHLQRATMRRRAL